VKVAKESNQTLQKRFWKVTSYRSIDKRYIFGLYDDVGWIKICLLVRTFLKVQQTQGLNALAEQILSAPKLWNFCCQAIAVVTIADSGQTEYCPTFLLSVRVFVTGVTSHISHIYIGINAMLIIKPYIFWIKIILAIFLAKTRPDKTIFSALTNLTIDFDFKLSKV